jgi:hypothetical protein
MADDKLGLRCLLVDPHYPGGSLLSRGASQGELEGPEEGAGDLCGGTACESGMWNLFPLCGKGNAETTQAWQSWRPSKIEKTC